MSVQEIFLLLLVCGLFAGILSGLPAMLAIAGVPFLVAVAGHFAGVFDLSLLQLYPARVWGIMSNPLLMAVPLFVLMGVLLERARLAERMLQVLAQVMGGSARGMALSVLLLSAMIAASTGIIGATVVMLVMVGLQPLLQAGVPQQKAAGLICASGTLGQIIPPSVLLVLLGDQIGNVYTESQQKAGNFAPDAVSVGDLFAGAVLPGLLLVLLYGLYMFWTLPKADNIQKTVAKTRVHWLTLVAAFLPTLLLIIAVLGSILAGVATPTEAAGLGAVGALLLAAHAQMQTMGKSLVMAAGMAALLLVILRTFSGSQPLTQGVLLIPAIIASVLMLAGVLAAVWQLLRTQLLAPVAVETIKISGMVFGIIIAASLLSLVFRGLGGDHEVEKWMQMLPLGEWGALLLIMLIVFLLGFVLEAVEIIYIVVPLLGPVVLSGDISPVWFAVLLAMNLQTSFLTPPFGFALFYFRSAAPDTLNTLQVYKGVAPFVVLQLMVLALVIIFPALATWL
ncbi:MAG: TRAP transporter large permease subunit [Thiolinea sp.]